jgi:hypothetical protein
MSFKWLEKELGRALKIAGNSNKYQLMVAIILCVIFFFNVFMIIGPSIYFMDPIFMCGDSDSTFDESYACQRIEECEISKQFLTESQRLHDCLQNGSHLQPAVQAQYHPILTVNRLASRSHHHERGQRFERPQVRFAD